MKSVPPPGENGAMILIGLDGYCCADASPAARIPSATTTPVSMRFISSPFLFSNSQFT
jgi:hypothetical protein